MTEVAMESFGVDGWSIFEDVFDNFLLIEVKILLLEFGFNLCICINEVFISKYLLQLHSKNLQFFRGIKTPEINLLRLALGLNLSFNYFTCLVAVEFIVIFTDVIWKIEELWNWLFHHFLNILTSLNIVLNLIKFTQHYLIGVINFSSDGESEIVIFIAIASLPVILKLLVIVIGVEVIWFNIWCELGITFLFFHHRLFLGFILISSYYDWFSFFLFLFLDFFYHLLWFLFLEFPLKDLISFSFLWAKLKLNISWFSFCYSICFLSELRFFPCFLFFWFRFLFFLWESLSKFYLFNFQ